MSQTAHAESALRKLSRRAGILDGYLDQSGTEQRETSDATRIALLGAMGFDVGDGASCRQALAALEREARTRVIAGTAVVPQREASRLEGRGLDGDWELTISFEDGGTRKIRGGGSSTQIELGPLPLGYHDLELVLGRGAPSRQRRIVVPERCPGVSDRAGAARAFGITAQLYSVTSTRNWGVGDMGDLEALVARAASWGAAFVGLNPLHALGNHGDAISPYSPVSRVYRNWIYIAVDAVPEFDGFLPGELAGLRGLPQVDYDAVADLKLAALARAYRRFSDRPADDARRRAFDAYVAREGDDLRDFATFATMSAADRRLYPHPGARGLDGFRSVRSAQIAFQSWLQFELDRQLAAAGAIARDRGLAIGLYQDLAIGCAADGSDVWTNPGLFVMGVSIGAPPDGYSASGQNWGLPPMDPRRLAATGYRYWVTLLRHAFAHGGALRMDHVLGLFRQFWIPAGGTGKDGAFVAFPTDDLLGILALEATRANAIVVGEDLGTVPEEVPGVLARYGVLSSRVVYLEAGADGAFTEAAAYPANALTTLNTHDMAPLAGWWNARDVDLKLEAGIIDAEAAESARTARTGEREALVRRLVATGVLPAASATLDDALVAAVHAFLAATPSALIGVSLDDVVGERDPVNVPGAGPDRHPSWRRKLGTRIEDLQLAPRTLPLDLVRLEVRPDGPVEAAKVLAIAEPQCVP